MARCVRGACRVGVLLRVCACDRTSRRLQVALVGEAAARADNGAVSAVPASASAEHDAASLNPSTSAEADAAACVWRVHPGRRPACLTPRVTQVLCGADRRLVDTGEVQRQDAVREHADGRCFGDHACGVAAVVQQGSCAPQRERSCWRRAADASRGTTDAEEVPDGVCAATRGVTLHACGMVVNVVFVRMRRRALFSMASRVFGNSVVVASMRAALSRYWNGTAATPYRSVATQPIELQPRCSCHGAPVSVCKSFHCFKSVCTGTIATTRSTQSLNSQQVSSRTRGCRHSTTPKRRG